MIRTCDTFRALAPSGCLFARSSLGYTDDPQGAAKTHLTSDRTTDCGAYKGFVTSAMRDNLVDDLAPILPGAEWTEADGSQDYLGVWTDWYGYEIAIGRHIDDDGLWFGRWGPDDVVSVEDYETAAECLIALTQAMHGWFRDGMLLMAERRQA